MRISYIFEYIYIDAHIFYFVYNNNITYTSKRFDLRYNIVLRQSCSYTYDKYTPFLLLLYIPVTDLQVPI